ncbi:FTR1 family protein [Polaromonas sp.]|uniref:FTR1 family iron permease n=1 Tax=Polaromonas sp. TaxID=1869339 RepID=UPI0017DF98D5|nr:FTR1 family protein [Polaromonas sp.]NMM04925.1 FTR1 family iron permease [Polaromonas sp.]
MGSTLFIVWRESLEAMLVVGILHSWLKFNEAASNGLHALWLGVGCGMALAGALGWAMVAAQGELSGAALEWFQIGMLLVAGALIVQMVLWMRRHGAGMRKSLHQNLAAAMQRSGLLGIAIVAALAIAREGAETAVFLYGVSLEQGGSASLVAGAALGFVLAGLTAWALGRGLRFLDYRRFFLVSGWMLLLFAVALLVNAVDRLIGAGLLPALVDPLWDSSWLLDDGSRFGSLLAALAGYRAHPSLMLVSIYAVYWLVVSRAMHLERRDA